MFEIQKAIRVWDSQATDFFKKVTEHFDTILIDKRELYKAFKKYVQSQSADLVIFGASEVVDDEPELYSSLDFVFRYHHILEAGHVVIVNDLLKEVTDISNDFNVLLEPHADYCLVYISFVPEQSLETALYIVEELAKGYRQKTGPESAVKDCVANVRIVQTILKEIVNGPMGEQKYDNFK